MSIFTKEDFKGISYLSFDQRFLIEDENQIIFAFNGTGKTSICDYLKQSRSSDCDFFDYDPEHSPTFKKNNTQYIIAPFVDQIQSVQNQIDNIEKNESIKVFLKEKKISTKDFDQYDKELANAYKQNFNYVFEDVSDNDMKIIDKYVKHEEGMELLKIEDKISKINDTNKELKDCSEAYLLQVFKELEGHYDEHTNRCPVCGTNNVDLKNRIDKKKKELDSVINSTFYCFASFRNETDTAKQNQIVQELTSLLKNKTKGQILSIAISNCDSKKLEEIKNEYSSHQTLKIGLADLKQKQTNFYKSMSQNKDFLEKAFPVEYPGAKIDFSEKKETITITLPRGKNQYSTGELHELLVIIRALSFKGSSKTKLIIDDPLSSYDFINQYRIIYRLVSLIHDKNKHLIIFTHDIDTINIANTQMRGSFKYYYIEKFNKTLSIIEMNMEKNKNSFLSLDTVKYGPNKYISLLSHREEMGEDYEGHKVFHYDEPFEYQPNQKDKNENEYNRLKNEYLASMIETNIVNNNFDFLKNTEEKIMAIISLRVWIEKQIYLFSKTTNDTNYQDKLIGKDMFEKLKLSKDRPDFKLYFANYNHQRLMMEKTMLNQNSHIKSQIIPFNFAINISLDDLYAEETTIKELFQHNDKLNQNI